MAADDPSPAERAAASVPDDAATAAARSRRGRRNRRWGAQAERDLAGYFKNRWSWNVRRTFAGDGQQNTDLIGVPSLHIEVKARGTWNVVSWIKQAEAKTLPGARPSVIYRPNGVTDPGQWLLSMRVEDLCHLLKELEVRRMQ